MRFEPDADQQALRDSLRRLLQADAPFERRRAALAQPAGWDAGLWRALADLGVTGLVLPDAQGGYGQRPVALLPMLAALGEALAVQPLLPCTVAAAALTQGGTPAQQAHWLPRIADGACVATWAHEEAAARHDPLWVETLAQAEGDAWRLQGDKHNVAFGASADLFVVSARCVGPTGPQGVSLFLVDRREGGWQADAAPLIDDTPAVRLILRGVRAQLLGEAPLPLAGTAAPALQVAREWGLAAVCAEALGLAERAQAMTVDYVQTRQQFGRPIGANQAVRHRVAEMRVALETVRSAAMFAWLALEDDDPARRAAELSRARLLITRHAGFITQQAVQLHGGIGMTVELAVGHCLRRLTVLDQLFGDAIQHAASLGATLAAPTTPTPVAH